jgi:hypothetical protein
MILYPAPISATFLSASAFCLSSRLWLESSNSMAAGGNGDGQGKERQASAVLENFYFAFVLEIKKAR